MLQRMNELVPRNSAALGVRDVATGELGAFIRESIEYPTILLEYTSLMAHR